MDAAAKAGGGIDVVDAVLGTSEILLAGVLNSGVDAVAGLVGLGATLFGGVELGTDVINKIKDVAGYELKTEGGNEVSAKMAEAIGEYIQAYEDGKQSMGSATLDGTGSPLLATAAYMAPELLMTVAGGFLGKALKNAGKGKGPDNNKVETDASAKLNIKRFDSLDDFNRAANNASPNTRYEFGDSSWTTDDLGRTIEARGNVQLQKANNRSGIDGVSTTAIGKQGVNGDVGFHLIGDQFNGATNKLNVVPGNGKRVDANGPSNLNQGAYAKFERQVKIQKQDNPNANVEMRIVPQYKKSNTTNRPDAFEASYRLDDGRWVDYFFKNKQGG
jgi:hypothetical protein